MIATIDFLEFAVKNCSLDDILSFLSFETVEFLHTGKFNNNYEKSLTLKGFCKIGYENTKSAYDIYVSLSGSGCRLLEDYKDDSFQWNLFIRDLVNTYDVDIRRIDVAIDDYTDTLNTKKLYFGYYCRGKFAGSCRSVPDFRDGRTEELIFGSTQSNYLIRIYNKALERGYKPGEEIIDTNTGQIVPYWWRLEQQMRGAKAQQFALLFHLNDVDKLLEISLGYVHEFIRFLTKANDKKNSQRIPVCSWWLKFLGDAQRIKFFSKPGSVYNLSKLDKFLNQQVSSSIKTYIHMLGLNPDELYHHFTSDDVILNGSQLALLRANAEGLYTRLYRDTVFNINTPDDPDFDLKQFQVAFINSILANDNFIRDSSNDTVEYIQEVMNL